jgi:hypothetical protein
MTGSASAIRAERTLAGSRAGRPSEKWDPWGSVFIGAQAHEATNTAQRRGHRRYGHQPLSTGRRGRRRGRAHGYGGVRGLQWRGRSVGSGGHGGLELRSGLRAPTAGETDCLVGKSHKVCTKRRIRLLLTSMADQLVQRRELVRPFPSLPPPAHPPPSTLPASSPSPRTFANAPR